MRLTDRSGLWVTDQVGRHGCAVNEVATEQACDWHTVMDAFDSYNEPCVRDPERIGHPTAVGLMRRRSIRPARSTRHRG
jgi:hypothetical protein